MREGNIQRWLPGAAVVCACGPASTTRKTNTKTGTHPEKKRLGGWVPFTRNLAFPEAALAVARRPPTLAAKRDSGEYYTTSRSLCCLVLLLLYMWYLLLCVLLYQVVWCMVYQV